MSATLPQETLQTLNDAINSSDLLLSISKRLSSKTADAALKRRPFVTLTYAQSLDGSISAHKTAPLLLSGTESMRLTHCLRAMHSAICVGSNPHPIVVDSHLRCPVDRKLLARRPVIACTRAGLSATTETKDSLQLAKPDLGPGVDRKHADESGAAAGEKGKAERKASLEAAGAEVLVCASDAAGHVDLADMLGRLGARFDSVMVEGGASIIMSLMKTLAAPQTGPTGSLDSGSRDVGAKPTASAPAAATQGSGCLVDQIVITIAPMLVGGVRAVSSPLAPANTGFPRLRNVQYEVLGADILCRGDP